MLVRSLGAVALVLGLCAPLVAGAATSSLDKALAAKAVDRDGYQPQLSRTSFGVPVETEPNDTPADADPVAVGEAVQADFGKSGDEDWFTFTASAGTWVAVSTASLDGSATDTVLEVYAADGTTLVAFDDDGGLGLFSALPHVEASTEGPWLIRVRHFSDLAGDAYQLVVEVGSPPPPVPVNDLVGGAIEVECNKAALGTSIGATSSLADLDCVGIETPGGEVFYRVTVPYSYQLDLMVSPVGAFDPALAVFLDPQDPQGSCVAGSDLAFAGEDEGLSWTNEEFENGVEVWIAVDSWAPASRGEFVLSVSCDFVVPVETASWSSLKAQF